MSSASKKNKKSNDVDAIVSALKSHAMESMDNVDDDYDDDDDELNSLLSDVISKAQSNQILTTASKDNKDEEGEDDLLTDYSDDEIDDYVENDDEEPEEEYSEEKIDETVDTEYVDDELIDYSKDTSYALLDDEDRGSFFYDDDEYDDIYNDSEPQSDSLDKEAISEYSSEDSDEAEDDEYIEDEEYIEDDEYYEDVDSDIDDELPDEADDEIDDFEDLFGGSLSYEYDENEYADGVNYFTADIDESDDIIEYRDVPADNQISIDYDNMGIYTISEDELLDDVGTDGSSDGAAVTEMSEEVDSSNIGELYMNISDRDEYIAEDEEEASEENLPPDNVRSARNDPNAAISNEDLFASPNYDAKYAHRAPEIHTIPDESAPIVLTPSEYGDYLQNTMPTLPTVAVSEKRANTSHSTGRIKTSSNEASREKMPTVENIDDEQLILDDDLLEDVTPSGADTLSVPQESKLTDKKKSIKRKTESKFISKEYSSPNQDKSIRKKYTSSINATIVRLAICSAITVFMLIFDMWNIFNSTEIFAGLFPIIEMLMLSVIVITMIKQLYEGSLAIFDLSPNIYSIPAFSTIILVIYNITLACVTIIKKDAFDDQKMILLGFVVGICAVSALLSDLASKQSESSTFNLMTSEETIYTAIADTTVAPIVHGSKKAKNYSNSESFSRTYRVKKARRVGKFMERSHKKVGSYGGLVYIMGVLPIVAFIFGCVSGFVNGNIETAISGMGFTVFLCLPISAIIFINIPYYVASRNLQKNKCAIVGEISMYECAGVQTLVFDDIDAMELTTGIEMKPDSESNIAKSTAIAKRVFTSLHMPLSQNYNDETGGSSDIVIKSIEANGIELVMDHSVNILIGDSSYFAAHDIMVKTNNKALVKYKDHTILYMAINRTPKLAYLVGCKARNSIFEAATRLAGVGVKTFINTYDPGINDMQMSNKRPPKAAYIGIFKSRRYEKYNFDEQPDGICIAAGDPANISLAVIISRKIVKTRKICTLLNYAFVALGLIISALIGMVPAIYSALTSGIDWRIWIVILFQIITLIPCIILSLTQLKIK